MNEILLKKLEEEFKRRKKVNPSYSLRAFARHLEVSPSLLSRVLNNKAPVTMTLLRRFEKVISLSEEEKEFYMNELQNSKGVLDFDHRYLNLDEFVQIQEWHNFAILEAVCLQDFEPTTKWIANKFLISEEEASLALKKLLDLELLINENGTLKKKTSFLSVTQDDPIAEAIRTHQRQVLMRGVEALDSIFHEKIDYCALTIAVDSCLLPEIKKKVRKMKMCLANYIIKNSKNKDQVYELSILMFPWSDQ